MPHVNPVNYTPPVSGEKYKVQSEEADFAKYFNVSSSLDSVFDKAASTYNVPKNLLLAVAKQESNFNPDARSYAGAMGIMQLMPATASSLGVSNPFDPTENIMGGAKLLSSLLEKYNGNKSYALAAYNAGSGNVDKYGGIPPFEQTQNYVAKILGYLKEGVSAPDTTVDSKTGNSNESASNYRISGSSFENADDYEVNDLQDLEELFSYDDYIRFLNTYYEIILSDTLSTSGLFKSAADDNESSDDILTALSSNSLVSEGKDFRIPINYNNSVRKLLESQKTEEA